MSFWENTEPGSQNTYLETPLELLLGASVSQFHSVFFGPDGKNPNNCKYVCSRSIKDEWLLLNMSCCVRCCNIVDRVYRGIVCTFCSSFHNPFKVTLFNVIYLWVVFVLQACALYLRLINICLLAVIQFMFVCCSLKQPTVEPHRWGRNSLFVIAHYKTAVPIKKPIPAFEPKINIYVETRVYFWW